MGLCIWGGSSKLGRNSNARAEAARALAGNRLLYRDGIPTAVLAADNIQFLESLDAASEWTAQKALLRGPLHAPSISPNGHDEVRREVADEVIA